MSAFPPLATELRTWREVRKVPDAELFKDHAGNCMILDHFAHVARLWVPTDLWPD